MTYKVKNTTHIRTFIKEGLLKHWDWKTYQAGEIVDDNDVVALKKKHAELIELNKPVQKKEVIDFDLNNDGKVDKKDISLMAKGLRKLSRKKSKK